MLKPGQRSRTNKSAEVFCPSKTSDTLACFKILTCFPFVLVLTQGALLTALKSDSSFQKQ